MFNCPTCQKEFKTGPQLGGHISSHNRKPRSSKKKSVGSLRNCKYCNKELEPLKLGAHTIHCGSNPNIEQIGLNRSAAARKRRHSDEVKAKLSQIAMHKVEQGTWHLSFSRSRTHEYKGIKFHGLWELKFAMHLDDKNVAWRRPTEKFQYTFEGKVRHYTPDFYIPEMESYVEIKGYQTPKDEAKWRQFPLKLIVLKGEDLIQMGLLEYNQVKKLTV